MDYNGNQVLRFKKDFKKDDLVKLSKELTNRVGTGNYDNTRTQFNYSYVPLNKDDLRQEVYFRLDENKIYYNASKKDVNYVNGAIVTSGKEFFESLGMNFKSSGRKIEYGENKGQDILIPDIKSNNDIPEKVRNFFDDSFNFLSDLVGKENIVYAEVHYDEDTPHLHFYFLPVVNEVRRKVFETDNNGNLIKKEVVGKDGKIKYYPIQKKDENGKNMFTIDKKKSLNCDQFWKNLGGETSFAKLQDQYNEYINKKGYNLYRGNIGDNKHHKTKAQKDIEDMNNQLKEMKKEFERNKQLNELEKETLTKLNYINEEEVLNPQKNKISLYKGKDVDNLINYSKQLKIENIENKKDIVERDITIESLGKELEELCEENSKLKDGRAIKERDDLIEFQKSIIRNKNTIIESLEEKLDSLTQYINDFKDKMYRFCDKICRALAHKLDIHFSKNYKIDYDEMEMYANRVNRKYQEKSDDFEL